MRKLLTLAVALVCSLVTSALAQPLADLVPENAVIYVGWRGGDSLTKDYEQTHLKALIDASQVQALFNDYVPRLLERMAKREGDENAQRIAADFAKLREITWKHPTALFSEGLYWPEGTREPMPKIALVCRAGPDAGTLLKIVTDLVTVGDTRPMPPELHAAVDGEFFVLSVGYPRGEAPGVKVKLGGGATLPKAAPFTAAMAKARKDPLLAIYVNAEAGLSQFDQAVAKGNDRQAKSMWPRVKDALGLTGLKAVAWTAGFEGKDWSSDLFVQAPAPRTGLLALIDSQALAEDVLRAVPATASRVTAGTFDLGRLLPEVRAAAGKVDLEAQDQMDRGLGQVNQMVGFDVQADLLAALGRDWAFYTDRTIGGGGGVGVVLVNQLRDGAKVQVSLDKLVTFANNVIAQQARNENVRIAFTTADVGGLKITYLATPVVSPGWAIKDGRMYVALYPQVIVSAVASADAKGPSILDSAAFKQMRARLGANAPTAISFLDLPQTAPEGYAAVLTLSRLALGFADLTGEPTPAMVVPPLHKVLPHVTPGGSAAWVDADGWHAKAILPFPGASLLSADTSSMGMGPMIIAAGVLMPALTQARSTARQMQSSTQLRGIHQGMVLFASGNNEVYPNNFSQLYDGNYFTYSYLFAPGFEPPKPAGFDQWPAEKKDAFFSDNGSFVILAWGQKSDLDQRRIVGYQKPTHAIKGMMSVVFDDNHVEAMRVADAVRRIKEQYPDHKIVGLTSVPPPPPAVPR